MDLTFDQLTISPMMVVLLLLYGLLIAFVLVLWTALDLRKKKDTETEPSRADSRQPERPARQPRPTPAPAAAAVQPEPQPTRTPTRPAADSDSVVSYSVRPRVNGSGPANGAATPARTERPAPPVTESDRPSAKDPPVTPPAIGRSGRQPSRDTEPVRTTTARRQEAPEQAAPAAAKRQKSEDAFERFLRSRTDEDDF